MIDVVPQLLAVVLEGAPITDELVEAIAASPVAQAELTRLAVVLHELPGDGARAAETRLDDLLEHVSLVAAMVIATARVPEPH